VHINTVVRPKTSAGLVHGSGGPLYATWLPISGLALLGFGVGGKRSRRRHILAGLALGGFLALMMFQAGCGSSSTTPPVAGGTPAGTYTVTLTAGTHTQTVTLVVQ
jgi:hypothetical protein